MTKHMIPGLILAAGLVAGSTAQADHNSAWGEGWANMPNDVHNTRIETLDADTDSFIDFVRMGSGADSDNRFLTDSDDTVGGGNGVGQRGGSARGGRS